MLQRAVIDLSHHNADVDFAQVKAAGVVGVIHKATEGEEYVDPTYLERRMEAQAEGLLWGAYHFLRPGDLIEQARFFVQQAGAVDLYAADHEDPGVPLDDLLEFLREVHSLTGKRAVIYSGSVLKEQIGSEAEADLAGYRLWIAHYGVNEPVWPKATWPKWWLWQWTESGNCPGVEGAVDLDAYDGTAAELIAEWEWGTGACSLTS